MLIISSFFVLFRVFFLWNRLDHRYAKICQKYKHKTPEHPSSPDQMFDRGVFVQLIQAFRVAFPMLTEMLTELMKEWRCTMKGRKRASSR